MVLAWQARLRSRPTFLGPRGDILIFPTSTANRLLGQCKAPGTLKSYDAVIRKFEEFADDNLCDTNPVTVTGATKFICYLADKKTSLADLHKVSPGLTLFHHSQGHPTVPAVQDPYVKLLISGAKREAARRKSRTAKATCLTKDDIHRIVSGLWPQGVGILDSSVDLITWRTTVKIFTMYKTWCRWDGYSSLTSDDVLIEGDSVTICFSHAKNDQFYCGSTCTLASLGPTNPMCPKLMFESYFKVMKFEKSLAEFLNCRIANKKGTQIAKATEKLSYTTSLENSKSLLVKFGLEGKYSEKSFKVSGVSEAFNQGISMEDAMYHGRWKSLETPGIYCHQNKSKRMKISLYAS